jgi:hypothetical protein
MGEDDHAAISVIDERLSFITVSDEFVESPSVRYYTIDGNPLFPSGASVTLEDIHRFISLTLDILNSQSDPVICYCGQSRDLLIRTVLLLSSFRLIELSLTPEEALAPFYPFRLLLGETSAPTAQSVAGRLLALDRGCHSGWFDPKTFDCTTWKSEYFQVFIPNKIIGVKFSSDTPPSEFAPVVEQFSLFKICGSKEDEGFVSSLGLSFTGLDFGSAEDPPRCLIPEFLDIIAQDHKIAIHITRETSSKIGILIACSLILQSGFELVDAVAWLSHCGLEPLSALNLVFLRKRANTLKKHNRWASRRLKKVEAHVVESQLQGPVVKRRRLVDQRPDPLFLITGRGGGRLGLMGPASQSMLYKAPATPLVAPKIPGSGRMISGTQSLLMPGFGLSSDLLREYQEELHKK